MSSPKERERDKKILMAKLVTIDKAKGRSGDKQLVAGTSSSWHGETAQFLTEMSVSNLPLPQILRIVAILMLSHLVKW